MRVKDSKIGKKIIANKGLQNALYVLIGIILFGSYLLIRYGALEGILPAIVIFILMDIISMLKIAWEELNPEKAAKFKWVWNKLFQYFNMAKKMKAEVNSI